MVCTVADTKCAPMPPTDVLMMQRLDMLLAEIDVMRLLNSVSAL